MNTSLIDIPALKARLDRIVAIEATGIDFSSDHWSVTEAAKEVAAHRQEHAAQFAANEARRNDETLPLGARIKAAFALPLFNRSARYLQLYFDRWEPFRDPRVAARVLVLKVWHKSEFWCPLGLGFQDIFASYIFPNLKSHFEEVMTPEARAFLDSLGPEFKLYCRQAPNLPIGLSWKSTEAQAKYGGILLETKVRRPEVAFAFVNEHRGERYDTVVLLQPPANIGPLTRAWEPEESFLLQRVEEAEASASLSAYQRIQRYKTSHLKRRSRKARNGRPQ